MGGELAISSDGRNFENKGGNEELCVLSVIQYEEFIAMACQTMNNPQANVIFAYTLKYDLFASIPLKSDVDLKMLVTFNE